mgnify:CR=1 FL=1
MRKTTQWEDRQMVNAKQTAFMTAISELSTPREMRASAERILKGLETLGYFGADYSMTDIQAAEIANGYTHQRKRS